MERRRNHHDYHNQQTRDNFARRRFERKLGENLESGKFGLTCINVAAETNNVVEWVTIGAPETYYAIGIHTISATVLTVDNDNFELNNGVYDTVKFTVWNAPDSFYAGIQDLYTFPVAVRF